MEEAAAPTSTIDCPYCSEPINPKSKKCKHCGEILDPQMREIEYLKSQKHAPQVFMNAGGGAAAAAAASGAGTLRRFRHWLHILLVIVTGGLWIPVYVLMYLFRNKRYYY
ncbi:hypothetical protein LGH82_19160 [Mesorhizobium sp. PAMC28654]|uniref:hypothetical protein n=1 Tax=Mesorhizobium sp. PAMC28654 TaxID=2880934 RepID=UPI001D0AF64E|nr:hypothetical protein [Mesorhizobium sp. PAMC28654]UDL87309.1 hypothetical protein LGH82_19160 [Mesorhizobium sp. PAMC28654]